MSDMRSAIIPKSDQINYEDFLGGKQLTIKITKVTIKAGEQPVTINYEGDNGKPFKPCKTVCKLLVVCWGDDSAKYIGRSMTLYGDPTVRWAGAEAGGIRICAMSDIDKTVSVALAESKGKRKITTVKPLAVAAEAPATINSDQQKELVALITANGIKPADFLLALGIKKSAELLADKMEAAKTWIASQSKGEA